MALNKEKLSTRLRDIIMKEALTVKTFVAWTIVEQQEINALARSVKAGEITMAQIQRYLINHPEQMPQCFAQNKRKPYAILAEIRAINKSVRPGRKKKKKAAITKKRA